MLGSKCKSLDCKWWDEETKTFGCRVYEALHIDHIKGNGSVERITHPGPLILNKIISLYYLEGIATVLENYQILCATCNIIKVHTNNEYRKKESEAKKFEDIDPTILKEPEKELPMAFVNRPEMVELFKIALSKKKGHS